MVRAAVGLRPTLLGPEERRTHLCVVALPPSSGCDIDVVTNHYVKAAGLKHEAKQQK